MKNRKIPAADELRGLFIRLFSSVVEWQCTLDEIWIFEALFLMPIKKLHPLIMCRQVRIACFVVLYAQMHQFSDIDL